MEDNYKVLANAIILQAVTDYRKALRGHTIEKVSPKVMVKRLEKFFRSDWYRMLTAIDGETIIIRLKEEYSNESNTCTSNT